MHEFFKKLRTESFLSRLSFILWICILIPFCVVIISYSINLARTKTQDIESRYKTNLSNFCLNFDKILSSSTKKLDFIFAYTPLSQILNTTERQNTLENVSLNQDFSLVFEAMTNDDYNIDLKIYSDSENINIPKYFYSMNYLRELPCFEKIDSLEKSEIYYSIQKNPLATLYVYRKYNYINQGYAVIELGIPCSQITELLDSVNLSDTSCYLELNDEIYDIFTWEKISNFPKNIVFKNKITENNSMVYVSLQKNTYAKIYSGIIILTLVILIIFCICLFLFTKLAARLLTKKLYRIIDFINEDKLQELDTDNIQKDEFGIILLKLSEYQKELIKKSEQENEYIKKMSQLEVNILQERMSPHFLYNTLASIKWIYNDARLGKLIDSIANYYRIMLNYGSTYTTIGNELDGINEYLTVQSFAYARELELTINCDEELRGHKILKNILQPIVENAFLHGINLSPDLGQVKISVFRMKENIVFRITNSGPPISEEKIEEINNCADFGSGTDARHGYALKNTISRIHIYYGKDYGITASLIDGFTTFDIVIPFNQTTNQEG